MTDDPIRDALRVAGDAVFDTTADDQVISAYDVAATAIAAFLRALPPRFPLPRPGGQTWGHAHGEMARIADAVERAARGDA